MSRGGGRRHGAALAALAGVLVGPTGCAHFERGEPLLVREEVVHTHKVEVPAQGSVVTFSTQGESLVVEASRACDVWQRSTVDRVEARRWENKTPAVDIGLAVAAVALGSAGGIVLADAADGTSDASASRVVGVTMILGGAFMGGAAVVDLVRSRRIDFEKHTIETEGRRVARDVACAHEPLPDAEVEVRLGRVGWLAGKTDATGHLTVPIVSAIGPEAKLPLRGATARVVVGGRAIGDLGLHALAVKREADAWRAVNLQDCVEPMAADACGAVTRYLEDYPDGPHAGEAGGALARAEPKLTKLREQAAWLRIGPSLATCLGKDAAGVDALEVACGVVAAFARAFPGVERAREAELAVAAGRGRVAAARAAAAKRKEEEAKRAAAAAKQRCAATCRVQCAATSRAHFDACLEGCLEVDCKAPPPP